MYHQKRSVVLLKMAKSQSLRSENVTASQYENSKISLKEIQSLACKKARNNPRTKARLQAPLRSPSIPFGLQKDQNRPVQTIRFSSGKDFLAIHAVCAHY